jgi:hypothetical protein
MHRTATRLALGLALAFAFTGCRSHQAKVADLQKQYDQLGAQFRKDCSAEMLNVPPKLSPKCKAEDKQVTEAWDRLKAARANK